MRGRDARLGDPRSCRSRRSGHPGRLRPAEEFALAPGLGTGRDRRAAPRRKPRRHRADVAAVAGRGSIRGPPARQSLRPDRGGAWRAGRFSRRPASRPRLRGRRGWLDRVAQTRIGRWLLDENTPQSQLMLAVFLCRLVPGLNMDALSYVAGITALSAWRFCLASFAALLPYTLIVVAAGQQLVAFGSDSLAIVVIGLVAFSALAIVCKQHWPRRTARTKPGLEASP
nr:VTT domain-containing protein [Methyloceanibacter methanicus]